MKGEGIRGGERGEGTEAENGREEFVDQVNYMGLIQTTHVATR